MRIKLDNDGVSMFPIHASYSVNARADVAYFYNVFLRICSVKKYWIMEREGWDIEEKREKRKMNNENRREKWIMKREGWDIKKQEKREKNLKE